MSDLKNKLKSVTNGKKVVTEILKKYSENEKVVDNIIFNLLSYHPTKRIDIKKIDYLVMKIRKPYNKLALYYKYLDIDDIDDISYVQCIENLFGKYKQDKSDEINIVSAFRNESHLGNKKQYFIHNTLVQNDLFKGKCDNCNVITESITTDHYPIPFKNILKSFLEIESIRLQDVDIYENSKNEIRISNKDCSEKWLVYHDIHSKYRLLCSRCNSSFGSYGN